MSRWSVYKEGGTVSDLVSGRVPEQGRFRVKPLVHQDASPLTLNSFYVTLLALTLA